MGRLGPYRILKVLGTGAMGVVFQAEDRHLKRMVALKVMRPSLAASAEFRRRFLREAQLAGALEHEHVVTVYQAGEDRGVPFLAMKLLQGETLEDRLNRTGGRLSLPEALRVGREIAEGLEAAHQRGLIHRDIKPANVWLEAGGDHVKIVDFGLARGSEEDTHFTQAGAVIGTPAYMAPEQANGAEVDPRCDLFSLGVVLYRAGTGELPFQGKDTLSILSALATRTPEAPHRLNPSLPQSFSDLVMYLLAKDVAGRPNSAREVAEMIAALERGEEDVVPTLSPQEESPVEEEPESEEAVSPALAAAKVRERGAAKPGVKRKGAKKARSAAARKTKPSQAGTDWARLVLLVSLLLLGTALLVLALAFIRRAAKPPAVAAAPDRAAVSVSIREQG
jgi:serine/threonine protein kinase